MLSIKKIKVALVSGVLVFAVSTGAFAIEMTLAGIKLGSPAATVLKKFGNPTRVVPGTVPVVVNTPGGLPGGMPGMVPGAPQTGGTSPLGAATGFAQAYGNYLNSAINATGDGQLPGLPGLSAPGLGMSNPGLAPGGALTGPLPGGIPGMPGMPGQPGQGQQILEEEQVTWTYDITESGTTIEFIISGNGRVVQITVGGDNPYALSKTSKGIKLGSYYKDVIFRYGYPERQEQVGRYLRASYADKHRAVFTFLGKKLVGITIALKPETEE